jgi:hypothetical protein
MRRIVSQAPVHNTRLYVLRHLLPSIANTVLDDSSSFRRILYPDPGLLDPPTCSDINLELLDSSGAALDLSCDFNLPGPSSSFDSFISEEAHLLPSTNMVVPYVMGTAPSASAIGPQLSQRARSLQQGSLTAKMILSRLTDYTRTMAKGRQMPPFIHPPCFSSDDECSSRSPHQCLPEKLSTCVNLTQMFYSWLPGSHSFVWQQIRTHVRQMRAEVSPIQFKPPCRGYRMRRRRDPR